MDTSYIMFAFAPVCDKWKPSQTKVTEALVINESLQDSKPSSRMCDWYIKCI